MKISFSNKKVESVFTDCNVMKKKLGNDLTRSLIKRMNQLESFECIYDLLKSPIDHPHLLTGNLNGFIAWSVDCRNRLILDSLLKENPSDMNEFKDIDEIIVKGVVDYHGNKNKWIIQ